MKSAKHASTRAIRIIKHEAVPGSGSYEVRFPDGRPSRFFFFSAGRTRPLPSHA